MADYPRFTELQAFVPGVESITLHDVPGEEHQTEVVIHAVAGATVPIRPTSDPRVRPTDPRSRVHPTSRGGGGGWGRGRGTKGQGGGRQGRPSSPSWRG